MASLKIGWVWFPTMDDLASSVKFDLPFSPPASCSPRGFVLAP